MHRSLARAHLAMLDSRPLGMTDIGKVKAALTRCAPEAVWRGQDCDAKVPVQRQCPGEIFCLKIVAGNGSGEERRGPSTRALLAALGSRSLGMTGIRKMNAALKRCATLKRERE